jgi:hypothetical protein
MIGHTIETPARFSWGSIVFALIGTAFVTGAIVEKNPHLGVFAVLPIALAIALWRVASRRLVALVHEDRLELLEPRGTVYYDELRSVTLANSGSRNAMLLIATEENALEIPTTANVPLAEIEQYLAPFVRVPPRSEPHPDMAEYVRQQRETFGADRVAVYTAGGVARPSMAAAKSRRGPAVCVALMLSGVLWCLAPIFVKGDDAIGWLGGGFMLAVFGFLFWLLFRQGGQTSRKVARKLADSCLVISPLGVAMIQGDVRGKLRWDEIRDVRHKGHNAGLQVNAANVGLFLIIEGSMVHIQNIYNAPLAEIEAKLRQNL